MDDAKTIAARLEGKRFGVVGVGNALKGDDGAGPALAAMLAARGASFPLVDASEVPENYGGWVEKQKLDAVVFVDAVEFGGAPGEWRLIPFEDLMHSASSTHRLSLHFLIRYLKEKWRGEALLIGVQPLSLKLGEGLSAEVDEGVTEIAACLMRAAGA
ncbi:MAG: hydrogenase 3 maturation endopeptidase HyCI [Candidatus Krumholzibacteria bacterium]|nr:hydrogenase 3 maturation endopeptidase HyCI [Candidatus Krumholzibacteria bacterium]